MTQAQKQGIYITQEDIDAALQAAPAPEMAAGVDDAKPLFLDEADIVDSGEVDSGSDDFFGLLSQDDIEALLHGDLDGASARGAQDEIDTLLRDPNAAVRKASSGRKSMAQEDVERVMQEAAKAGGAPNTAKKAETASQDDIDRLLMEALDKAAEDSDGDTALEEAQPGLAEAGDVLFQEDLDLLLSGASGDDDEGAASETMETALVEAEPPPKTPPEAAGGAESLISPSDMEQLMGTSAAGGARDAQSTSEHISQDDINRLLKESLEEAEELLEEEAEAPEDETDLQEPVILVAEEEPPEPPAPALTPAPSIKIRKISLKKRVRVKHMAWAAAAAGVVLLVLAVAVMMPSRPTETAPETQVLTFSLNQERADAPEVPMLSDTLIRLPGFVVFAPPGKASITYLAADLILDVPDAAISTVIKENEAFVRDIIYGTISGELMTRDISTIDKVSLELAIRKALGRVMARDAIARISFDRLELV